MRRCEKCGKLLNLSQFLKREDRKGFYAFCNGCMIEQAREPDWPGYRERGGGSLELEPRD